MSNISIAEYLAQVNRSANASVLGENPLLKKAFTGTAYGVDGGSNTSGNIFTTTYGRKVWQALNNQTRFWNAIPHATWGNTAGWRVRTDRGTGRSRPVTELGTLPTPDVSDLQLVSGLPKIVATTFASSVKAMYTAQLEGGIGDILATENEHSQRDHVKELQQETLRMRWARVASATNSTNAVITVVTPRGNNFQVGDTCLIYDQSASANMGTDAGNDNPLTVDATTATTVTFTGEVFNATPVAGDILFVTGSGNNGVTSIDSIVEQDGRVLSTVGGDAGSEIGAYDLTQGGRTAGTWNAAATVSNNGGTARDLTLETLNSAIQAVRENGGEPKLIVTGHDQYFKLEELLQTQQRFMGIETYQVNVGSEKTFAGTRTGMELSTYMGIPILPDADAPKSADNGGTEIGSNVFVLDTDYLEVAVAQPTQYIENRDFFAVDALAVRGLFYTMAELRCYSFFHQAKITDLTA